MERPAMDETVMGIIAGSFGYLLLCGIFLGWILMPICILKDAKKLFGWNPNDEINAKEKESEKHGN